MAEFIEMHQIEGKEIKKAFAKLSCSQSAKTPWRVLKVNTPRKKHQVLPGTEP